MADTTSHQPYQFGDVVDGYRWTITGWEPVTAPARTVGVPRLLEARYAATQKARMESREAPPQVVPGEQDEPDQPDEPAVDLDAVLNRRVVAAPDLVVEFHEPEAPADVEPWSTSPSDVAVTVDMDEPASVPAYDDDSSVEPLRQVVPEPSAAAESQRSWYGLGWDSVDENDPATDDDSDAPFAAALALGARTLAEQHQPSDIEIAAGLATAASRGDDRWSPTGWDQVDEWTGDDAGAPPAQARLDAHALAYSATADAGLEPVSTPVADAIPEAVPSDLADGAAQAMGLAEVEVDLTTEARVVTVSPEPPAGWYPG